jgi:hypothetical protein
MALEGVDLVLAALSAGVSAGVTDSVKSTVTDSWRALRDKIAALFSRAGDSKATASLELFEIHPEQTAELLASYLRAHNVDQNEPIMLAAQTCLQSAGPSAIGEGSVAAHVLNIVATQGGVATTRITGNVSAGYTPSQDPR